MKKDKLIDDENSKALLLKKDINRLEVRVDKLSYEINNKKKELQLICIHNKTREKNSYVEGGYLNRSEHTKRIICATCGKVLDEKITYGGFG